MRWCPIEAVNTFEHRYKEGTAVGAALINGVFKQINQFKLRRERMIFRLYRINGVAVTGNARRRRKWVIKRIDRIHLLLHFF
ncbi:hypothetical protein [Photobacterium leiognathi]|uniref:hypothetical protein n=1 Tax=Photobacterium leiognathi TaxID=553611 RepID=UPI002159A886|nr:hypothetical protein [Photobacterium leiognathi]